MSQLRTLDAIVALVTIAGGCATQQLDVRKDGAVDPRRDAADSSSTAPQRPRPISLVTVANPP